jgi:hypothetical protein
MKMPDLQSELTKALAKSNFDDEPGGPTPPTFTAAKSKREELWEVIRDNPMISANELADKAGVGRQFAASAINGMYIKSLLTRTQINGLYRYTSTVDTYPRFDHQAHGVKLAELSKMRKPKKKVVVVKRKPAQPTPAVDPISEFNADVILGSITVVQARQLLDKLKVLFGA